MSFQLNQLPGGHLLVLEIIFYYIFLKSFLLGQFLKRQRAWSILKERGTL